MSKILIELMKHLQPASNYRIHTFIATSDLHMKYKLRLSKEQVLENIKKALSMREIYVKTLSGVLKTVLVKF